MQTTGSKLRIRHARPDEAESLTDLIMRSKAHWGYDPALLEAWRADHTLDASTIARDAVYCAEDADTGVVVGVSHLYPINEDEIYLDRLFVEPAWMGRGVGSRLWRHAVALAAEQGAKSVALGADPNARPFYERMGAVVVGWSDSSLMPGSLFPNMRYDLPPHADPS
jgi:GNAT superfamily N-acetyltransferase